MTFESAHLAHILFAVDSMNDASRSKEETCFKECMGYEMEDCGGVSTDSASKKHITNLADCGIGQNTFDIVLGHAYGRRHDRSESTNSSHDHHRHGRKIEKRTATNNHVNACCYHGRGMNQGTYRCGTFHSVRKPGIKRNLR